MPEPITHSTGGAVLAVAPAVMAANGLFGIEYAAIGWAFIGGCLALIWLERFEHWGYAMASIVGSTIIGSAIGQWSAAPVLLTVQHFAQWLTPWAMTAEKTATCFIALAVGLLTQKAMPGLFRRVGILSEGSHG